MNHHARKRFGQHFLENSFVLQQILDSVQPLPIEHLIEIGPGKGALTTLLLNKTHSLDVIELDRDLISILKKNCGDSPKLRVHLADALTVDFSQFQKPCRIVGNLPYNISTPLIFHLIHFSHFITDMHFMLQKEVVDRLVAMPGCKQYGRLSVMIQYHCQTFPLFAVAPSAFNPAPRVQSTFVRLIPHKKRPFIAKNEDLFAQIVRQAFMYRRKTLHNALKEIVKKEIWEKINMDAQLRAEMLSVSDFVTLSNTLESDL